MDPLDLVILALRVALVAVLYLFLFTVLRVAARGLQPTQARPRRRADSRRRGLALVVVETGTAELQVGQVIEVADGATLGRAERAAVTVADATVSAEHARITRVGRAWVVSDLGSTNGTRVNDARVDGETPLTPGDVLALGNVKLQVVAP